jgi:hypothetical protein
LGRNRLKKRLHQQPSPFETRKRIKNLQDCKRMIVSSKFFSARDRQDYPLAFTGHALVMKW